MTATVVTGIGVVAPTGLGAVRHWDSTVAGRGAIRRITAFDPEPYSSTLAGEISGFEPGEHLPHQLLPQTDRVTRLSLVAVDWALQDAQLDPAGLPEYGMGVVTASSAGGFEFGQRELEKLWSRGPEHVSAYQSFAWFYAVNTGQISIRHGLRGPNGVLVTEQSGGLDAIAQARRRIRDGAAAMICGSIDGSPCPWGWVAQLTNREVSRSGDPGRAYLPFDVDAAGYVPGDGGALLVLESEANARERGVPWYGEAAGYAASFDPPPASGRPGTLRRAIEGALADARMAAGDVDVVFADGAGTPGRDREEAAALRAVFGRYGVPVTVPKTMTGRLSAGGAALDVATALLALRNGLIPPTVNVLRPVPDYEIDLVTRPRRRPLKVALVVARGRGGFNAAMVLTGPGGDSTTEGRKQP
ncbi:ketosynthase chain-length factor [Micromonospora sp. DT53]|uniref:ketosynthase chain-length factor n=1 Tax=Micromonospora sp. DT53 TaxID=3393444 RepID=UPI003CF23AFF